MSTISDELFDRFMEGEATPEETITVLDAMKTDKELMKMYISVKRFDAMMAEDEEPSIPLEKMAAKSEDNMCDILCERYILHKRLGNSGSLNILSDAKNEQLFLKVARGFDEGEWIAANEEFFSTPIDKLWLTSKGVALYNVGRILEGYGLSVTRHFNSSVNHLKQCLKRNESLIAIVNEEILSGEANSDGQPNHAICILSVEDELVRVFNPTTGNTEDSYPLDGFVKAWETSRNYVVAVGEKGDKLYEPTPINLDDVELDDDLEDLLEAIAENAHDVWAKDRVAEGYVYGPVNNSDPKKGPLTNKDLRPYSELPDSEKDYDRKMAVSTLKLAKRLGFKVSRINPEEEHHCPTCGKVIGLEMSYCPYCGRELQLDDFIK